MKAGILLFDGVEVLDFAGPYEVLSAARQGESLCFATSTVAEKTSVVCSGGLQVISDFTFESAPDFDILVVPGGPGTRGEASRRQNICRYIARAAQQAEQIAGVCTGTFLMAEAGLLDGIPVTTHHRRREALRQQYPGLEVVEAKVLDGGKIITAGGVSSGIDMALYLVEKFFGKEAAAAERERIEYGINF
ncbi:MAG: DJ-1/PfpI family protein [bacterium]|jgi:transcriptional regulator GlxA family with amidase domain